MRKRTKINKPPMVVGMACSIQPQVVYFFGGLGLGRFGAPPVLGAGVEGAAGGCCPPLFSKSVSARLFTEPILTSGRRICSE